MAQPILAEAYKYLPTIGKRVFPSSVQ